MESTVDYIGNSTEVVGLTAEPVSRLKWEIKVFMFLGALGVIDNGFTLLIISSSKTMRQKVNNKLIINQSAIDWLASVLLIADAPTFPDPRSPPGVLGDFYCRVWVSNYFLWSCLTSSSLNLMAIAIERYIEIVKPLRYKEIFTPVRATLTMAGMWIGGLLFMTVPCIAGSGIIHGICIRYTAWPSNLGNISSGIHTFLAMYLIPLAVMVFCYIRIFLVIRARNKVQPRNKMSAAEKKRAKRMIKIQRNIMKTLILVTAAFIICWSCNLWGFLLITLGADVDINSSYYQAFIFMSYTNSWINPFIYTFQYQEFQEAMKKLFCKRQETDEDEM